MKFQSTPPHGRRPASLGDALSRAVVSIHASAREATISRAAALWTRTGFNPRLRTGGDFSGPLNASQCMEFQSTPPHGRRQAARHKFRQRRGSFNPRLRTGGDASRVSLARSASSFNPRLRTGGDPRATEREVSVILFQSTPPHGRRHGLDEQQKSPKDVSIHASAREATWLRW